MPTKTGSVKKTDLRVIKTEQAITDAFIRLLSQTEYSKISIAALAREANINRKTFYAHYATIDDLLESVYISRLQEIYEPALEQAETESLEAALRLFIHTILQALEENFDNEMNLLRNVGLYRLSDMVIGPLEAYVIKIRTQLNLPPLENLHRYIVCSVASLLAAYADWRISGRQGETLEELGENIYLIISSGVTSILES